MKQIWKTLTKTMKTENIFSLFLIRIEMNNLIREKTNNCLIKSKETSKTKKFQKNKSKDRRNFKTPRSLIQLSSGTLSKEILKEYSMRSAYKRSNISKESLPHNSRLLHSLMFRRVRKLRRSWPVINNLLLKCEQICVHSEVSN